METLPEEIRNGVAPLIFAIDVTSPSISNKGQVFQDFLDWINTSSDDDIVETSDFLESARVVAVSRKHAFPPSKDPDGINNRSSLIMRSRANPFVIGHNTSDSSAAEQLLREHPRISSVEGLLPKGWVEKHQHALPSVLLLTTIIDCSVVPTEAVLKDIELANTVDQLHSSLASKRECRTQLICFFQRAPGDSDKKEDEEKEKQDSMSLDSPSSPKSNNRDAERLTSIRSKCRLAPSCITSIELPSSSKTTVEFDDDIRLLLSRKLKESSSAYYLSQARRAKRKLTTLHVDKYPQYLSLAARYCFKIATFYDFQLKAEKSLQYYTDSYKYIEQYYKNILFGLVGDSSPNHNKQLENENRNPTQQSVEVALIPSSYDNNNPSEEDDSEAHDEISDMTFQCRALASLTNFKILQNYLSNSPSDGNLVSATTQWKKHMDLFFKFVSPPNEYPHPKWFFLVFLKNERLILSQLLGKFVFDTSFFQGSGGSHGEVLVSMTAWRQYASTAESFLLLQREIQQEVQNQFMADESQDFQGNDHYVGGISQHELKFQLQMEAQSNHLDLALVNCKKAIELYDKEVYKSPRSCARVNFLAGKILMEQNNYEEALPYLEKAIAVCPNWPGLRYPIMKAIEECTRSNSQEIQNNIHAEILLDTSLNVSPERKIEAFQNLLDSPGEYKVVWPEHRNENAPFSYSLTFPGSTHVNAGNIANAIFSLQSHISSVPTFSIKSIQLLTTVGPVDLELPTTPPFEVTNDNTTKPIFLDAHVPLPLHLANDSDTKVNDSTTLNKKKTAKLCSSGLTQAGGTLFVVPSNNTKNNTSEQKEAEPSSTMASNTTNNNNNNIIYDNKYYGGASVNLLGIVLTFGNTGSMELTMSSPHKSKNVSSSPPDSTPPPANRPTPLLDEDNYNVVAWNRPEHHPFSLGPRCLRILSEEPLIKIKDITSPITHSRALEGVVNRIVLQIEAGERCKDLCYSIKCENTIEYEADDVEEDLEPIIVVQKNDSLGQLQESLEHDCTLPEGWDMYPYENGLGSLKEFHKLVDSLNPGERTYVCVDIFKPSSTVEESSECQTKFELLVEYTQVRDLASENKVQKKFTGNVIWAAPLETSFSIVPREGYPCGANHPSNMLLGEFNNKPQNDDNSESDLFAVDGDDITVRCTIQENEDSYGLNVELLSVLFQVSCPSFDYILLYVHKLIFY